MIGTSNEILMWLSRHSEYAPLLQMSRQRLVGMRKHLYCNEIGEQTKEEILLRLKNRIAGLQNSTTHHDGYLTCGIRDVRCLRERYILPAVVRDKHGKFFQETTMIRMVAREEKMADLNLDKVCATMKYGCLPSERIVSEVLRRKGWNMFEPRHELPSVWEVETDY